MGPILFVMLLVSLFVVLAETAVWAPFIYSIF